ATAVGAWSMERWPARGTTMKRARSRAAVRRPASGESTLSCPPQSTMRGTRTRWSVAADTPWIPWPSSVRKAAALPLTRNGRCQGMADERRLHELKVGVEILHEASPMADCVRPAALRIAEGRQIQCVDAMPPGEEGAKRVPHPGRLDEPPEQDYGRPSVSPP